MVDEDGALDGMRVLDLSTYLPGPYATMLLADLGAEVVHVEPSAGDPGRHLPDRMGSDSALHWWIARNKSSLSLDLKAPADRERLLREVERADVLVESFRPGVAARLGVDYAACRAVNDGIVYCAISSYGDRSRNPTVPAHDLNYSAKSGMLGLSLDGGGAPVMVGFPVADVAGGLHAAVGILAAYQYRLRTGRGQFVVGILASSLGMTGLQLIKTMAGVPPRQGVDLNMGGDPGYGLYRAADGRFLSLGCIEDKFWRRLCEVLGRADLIPRRFIDPEGVRKALATVFATRDRAEWDELLQEEDVCYGPVNDISEVGGDREVIDSGMVTQMAGSDGRIWPQLANPIHLSVTPPRLRTPAPGLDGNGTRPRRGPPVTG